MIEQAGLVHLHVLVRILHHNLPIADLDHDAHCAGLLHRTVLARRVDECSHAGPAAAEPSCLPAHGQMLPPRHHSTKASVQRSPRLAYSMRR